MGLQKTCVFTVEQVVTSVQPSFFFGSHHCSTYHYSNDIVNNEGSQKKMMAGMSKTKGNYIYLDMFLDICVQLSIVLNGQKDHISSRCRDMQKILCSACYKQHSHVIDDQFKN